MQPLRDDEVTEIGSNPDLLELFYREHVEFVKRFLARRIADPHTVADLTADVFLAAMKAAPRYRPEAGRPGAWLTGIARNVVADHHRQVARRLRAESRIEGHRLLDEESTTRIAQMIDAQRLSRLLFESIADLPDRDRALLELVAVDGMSIAEAADLLGIKAGNARVRLHRSRTRVQTNIQTLASRNGIDPALLAHLVQEATS